MCSRDLCSPSGLRLKTGLLILLFTFLVGFAAVQLVSRGTSTTPHGTKLSVVPPKDIQRPVSEIVHSDGISVAGLCSRLREIKTIPYDPNEISGDLIYDGLRAAGKQAIPCLIDKLTDTEMIESPEGMMPVKDFRVGDAATFLLLYNSRQVWDPETMFPPKYRRIFQEQGIFAYYAYVDKPTNRRKFQLWWKNWLKKERSEYVQP